MINNVPCVTIILKLVLGGIYINIEKYLNENLGALSDKTILISGCTGGIGKHLCRYVLALGGNLIMLDRNKEKSLYFKEELLSLYPNSNIENYIADMADIESVKSACYELKSAKIDFIIHNAGAYKIPRKICKNGYDNVFNINFVSPYFITKTLLENIDGVVLVGSIANYYSKIDFDDIDFQNKTASSLIYGNSKRYSMYAHFELFKDHPKKHLAITHPGITLTGITDHFPKWLFPIMKPIMRIIFMKPDMASLSILEGLFKGTRPYFWIGPATLNIWGKPKLQKIKKADDNEIEFIYKTAEEIYKTICDDI